jgi:hypothetical protein
MTNDDGSFRDPPRIRGRLPRRAGDVRFRAVIVAAPSVHTSGGRYEWVNASAEVTPAPDWLVAERDEPLTSPAALLPGWATKLLVAKDVDDARRFSELSDGDNRPLVAYAIAVRLGRWVAAGLLDYGIAEELLMESAATNGALEKYGEDDFLRQMRNGLEEGMRG